MPKMNKKSLWRAEKCKIYQQTFMQELPKVVKPRKKFRVKDVWHKVECLEHLSDSYAYDIAIAICTQAHMDGVLERTGKFFSIKEKVS
jgi:hypothetical protein